jgi:hypothetical protein
VSKTIQAVLSLFLFFLPVGCATNFMVPVVDVPPLTPSIAQKIPLKVAVVIPEEVEAATFAGPPDLAISDGIGRGVSASFPLGKMLQNEAPDVFSSVFTAVVLARGSPYPQDIDAVILPSIDHFQYWYTMADSSLLEANWLSHARASLQVRVLDKSGTLLFEKTVSSDSLAQTEGKIYHRNERQEIQEVTGRAAAESIAAALENSAKFISMSPEIQAYASEKVGYSIATASAAPEQHASGTSDVDVLPTAAVKTQKDSYAIVIGIEQYRQKLPKADFAVQDAQTMARYLTTVMGYPEENVVTLLNDRALKSDFEKYFGKWLGNNVEKDSTVFIYFSGHGAPDPKTGGAYLVPYDGDPTFIAETGYPLKRMYAALEKLPAKKVIVALDSCFSGAGGRSVIAKGARPLVMNLQTDTPTSKNMTVMSASSGSQISSTYTEKGHGLFTYFLLKGIKTEDVVNPDGSINIDDLFAYLQPRVERIARKQYNNEQTPQLMGSR